MTKISRFFTCVAVVVSLLSSSLLFTPKVNAQQANNAQLVLANYTNGDPLLEKSIYVCYGSTTTEFLYLPSGTVLTLELPAGDYSLRVLSLMGVVDGEACINNSPVIYDNDITLTSNVISELIISGLGVVYNPPHVHNFEQLTPDMELGTNVFGVFIPDTYRQDRLSLCIDGVLTEPTESYGEMYATSQTTLGLGMVYVYPATSINPTVQFPYSGPNLEFVDTDCELGNYYPNYSTSITIQPTAAQSVYFHYRGDNAFDQISNINFSFSANSGLINEPELITSEVQTPEPGQGQLIIRNNLIGDLDVVQTIRVCVNGQVSSFLGLLSGQSLTVNLQPGSYDVQIYSDPFNLNYAGVCTLNEAMYFHGAQNITVTSGIISELLLETENDQPVIRIPGANVNYEILFNSALADNQFGIFYQGAPLSPDDLSGYFPMCLDGVLTNPSGIITDVNFEGDEGFILVYTAANNSVTVSAGLSAYLSDTDCLMGDFYEEYNLTLNLNVEEVDGVPPIQPIMFRPQPGSTLFSSWDEVTTLSLRFNPNIGSLTQPVLTTGIQNSTDAPQITSPTLVRSGAGNSQILSVLLVFVFYSLFELSLCPAKKYNSKLVKN